MKQLILTFCFLLGIVFFPLAQDIPVLKYDDLAAIINRPGDTVIVVNFWATWCAPCVKEIPHFETLRSNYAGQPLKVYLVSIDFVKEIDSRVKPFVQSRNLQSHVVVLEDKRYDYWMTDINQDWQGNIPATLILRNSTGYRHFIGSEVTYEELAAAVNEAFTHRKQ